MSDFDWNSITRKLYEYLGAPEVEREIEKIKDDVMLERVPLKPGDPKSAKEAGEQFGAVLQRAILREHRLPPGVERALYSYDVTEPFKVSNGSYIVLVFFEDDPTRETMSTLKTYYPVDISELYNDGVDHMMAQIIETDKMTGMVKFSSTVIPGTHFMEQAIDDFMGNYGSDYNVVKIDIERNNT